MRNPFALFWATGLLVVSAGSSPAAVLQQTNNLLGMDTYLEMESVGSPRISPDGGHILFTRGEALRVKRMWAAGGMIVRAMITDAIRANDLG